jgi:hypothetical protein
MTTIETVSGEMVKATHVQHLRTLTSNGHGGEGNRDVDLYRTQGGRLVVAISYPGNCTIPPQIDPDSNPSDYGISDE